MNHEHHQISLAAAKLADRLPYAMMISIASAISSNGNLDRSHLRQIVLQAVPTAQFRDAASGFIDKWFNHAPMVGNEAVALALVTAATSEHDHKTEESVEIVWTGPDKVENRFRHTEQAILEVLNSATKKITVVSYAVYRIPRIRDALIAAANRGVDIRLIVETPNRIEGQGEYDCVLALGTNVASACSVYFWPEEKRDKVTNVTLGKPHSKFGILHVKCAVADGNRLFLSSANFTEYAFTINMELGLLVTGGKLPSQVERHFEQMIELGEFQRV
jgi:phosphatidylserine/phosphatidylglycerophosphate/cardiolipin synthase-like enzyme